MPQHREHMRHRTPVPVSPALHRTRLRALCLALAITLLAGYLIWSSGGWLSLLWFWLFAAPADGLLFVLWRSRRA